MPNIPPTPAMPAAANAPPGSATGSIGTGPVGTGEHVVKAGECISSIARDTGHFWKTIWNDPQNAELKSIRKEPNLLLPGDRVHVPDKRPKQEPGQTEMRHRFVRKGEPAHLKMRILVEHKPVANTPYTLLIDKQESAGVTDADGVVSLAIPGNARAGTLTIHRPGQELIYKLMLGNVPPITEISGVQTRLANLGYLSGSASGVMDPATRDAILSFQKSNALPESGNPDAATQQALKSKHGC